MSLSTAAALIGELGILLGVLVPIIAYIKKLTDGQRCQLRSEMLRIYYRNHGSETIHQYEYENFALLYQAYKALKGNSFVDKLWRDVQRWEIVTRKDVLK